MRNPSSAASAMTVLTYVIGKRCLYGKYQTCGKAGARLRRPAITGAAPERRNCSHFWGAANSKCGGSDRRVRGGFSRSRTKNACRRTPRMCLRSLPALPGRSRQH